MVSETSVKSDWKKQNRHLECVLSAVFVCTVTKPTL